MPNENKQVTALDVVIDHISRIKKYLSDEPCNYCPLCIDNEENKYRPECGLSETPPRTNPCEEDITKWAEDEAKRRNGGEL